MNKLLYTLSILGGIFVALYITYDGTADLKYTIKFENMSFDEARRRLKFNHLRTNLDDGLTVFDKNILQDCRKLAENAWHKDCGLAYQVKEQGR